MKNLIGAAILSGAALLGTTAAWAAEPAAPPTPPPALPYGPPITLAQAEIVMQAAEAMGKTIPWGEAIAIVEPSGALVMFAKLPDTQYAAEKLALDKAHTAAQFRRPTELFEKLVTGGAHYLLGLDGAIPVGGGVPIVVDGHIIGAIGASGAPYSLPDSKVAQAGAAALK